MSAFRGWGLALALLLLLLGAVRWSERLPRPLPATAAATMFSASRAWPLVSLLADTIGARVTGTPGAELAAEALAARLRTIPRLEVEVQDVTGVRASAGGATAYRVRNVLARLPGDSASAVLISSHYDGPEEGVGASDAAVPTAVIVEMVRALAAESQLRHTIVININGAEERGLLGAHGFLRHPWMRQVRAFVDLESAGTAGKAILFQVGPGNAWLVRAYARSAPHPYGTVIGQDVFQSGVIPSRTDFEVYAAAGIPGLDIAFFRDGYAYHTGLDRPEAIALGSVQHMGANALALVRELATGPLPKHTGGGAATYHDLLGVTMIAYDSPTARLLAVLAAVLALAATAMAVRRLALPLRLVAARMLVSAAAAALGIAVAVAASALPYYGFGRAHGWFAHPLRGVVAYAAITTAVMLGAHTIFRWGGGGEHVATNEARAAGTWCGGLLLLVACLLALTHAGLGSAYLLLWWVVPGALGLGVLAATRGERWTAAAVAGLLPGALLTLQFTELLLALFLPIAGRLLLSVPFDLVIAGLVGAAAALILTLPLALVHRGGRPGAAALVVGGIGLAALALTTVTFPFTPARPQRIAIVHEELGHTPRMVIESGDFLGPRTALARLPVVLPLAGRRNAVEIPAGPTGNPPPVLLLESATSEAPRGRTVKLRLPPTDAYMHVLRIPVTSLAAWSVGEPIHLPRAGGRYATLRLISAPDTGWLVTLRLSDDAPVPLAVAAVRTAVSEDAGKVLRLLPAWTTAHALTVDGREIIF